MNTPLLELRSVCAGYGDREVLDGVDLAIRPGERIALVGANGAGKSSLLALCVGLLAVNKGEVVAFGQARRREQDFHEVRRRVGMLFQDSDDQLFCPTVLEDVVFGPLNLGLTRAQAKRRAEQTLDALGIPEFAQRITHRLSGGEKRLVALATVLAMQPEVLLLDEPTNGLDEPTAQRITDYLDQLPMAMLLVSHDQRLLGRLARRALILAHGQLNEGVLHSHPHVHQHPHVHRAMIEHGSAIPPHEHPHDQ